MANRNEAAWELAEQTAVAMLVGGVSTAGPDAAALVTAAGPLLQAGLRGIIGAIRGTRTKHAAETLVDAAREAGAISADWAVCQSVPQVTVAVSGTAATGMAAVTRTTAGTGGAS